MSRRMHRFRGFKALVHDAVDGVVDLIEEGHESTARAFARAANPIPPFAGAFERVERIRRASTRGVLGGIKRVNRAVQVASDAGLAARHAAESTSARGHAAEGEPGPEIEPAVPMRSDAMMSAAIVGDAVLGLLNGFVGDRLFARENGLDLGLLLRVRDHYVDPAREPSLRASVAAALGHTPPGARIAVFVHGLATTEWSWVLEAQAYHGDPTVHFGVLLERDLGSTPVHVRYNTGRSISTNGRALAAALDALVRAYPVPVEEIVLIGHSMGGLVSRSACHHGAEASMPFVSRVKRVICLGSPHEGAPFAKLGHTLASALDGIDLPATRITSRILEGRSAGIKDLRHGFLAPGENSGRDPEGSEAREVPNVPLLPNVTYHFVSATVTRDTEHPFGRLMGDVLVRVPSGHAASVRESHFVIERTCLGGVLHHQMQNHPDIYGVIRQACEADVAKLGVAP